MDKDKKQKILSAVWSSFKAFFIAQAGNILEVILVQLLKIEVGGGIRGAIIRLAIKQFREEIGEPIAKAILVEGGYTVNKVEGKLLVTKLHDAQGSGNVEDYNSTVDDINS